MKLSIVIPAFNSAAFISACIDSCIGNVRFPQDEYEIIVIDDGSTDNTVDVVRQHQAKCSNLIVHSKPNGGVSSARNIGLGMSTGEFVLFIDSDDEVFMHGLDRLNEELDQRPVDDLLIMKSRVCEEGGTCREVYTVPKELRFMTLSGTDLFRDGYSRGSACGVAFRREFLLKKSIRFPESVRNGEDSLFMTLCFMHSMAVRCVDIDFYKVKVRDGSASRDWDRDRLYDFIDSLHVLESLVAANDYSSGQLAMISAKSYGIISNAVDQYWKMKRRPPYLDVRSRIKRSGMYPIRGYEHTNVVSKARILNLSFELFCILSFVGGQGKAVVRSIRKNVDGWFE